jgi:hypothetical protein
MPKAKKKSFSVKQVCIKTGIKAMWLSPTGASTVGIHFTPQDMIEHGVQCILVGMASKNRAKITGRRDTNGVSVISDVMNEEFIDRLKKRNPIAAALLRSSGKKNK